ncbi:MAG TPA: hypothetical protein VNX21_04820 [Candidatus Thermoplasmatota archaeon]|nr:hypothetical protein [Candidatus Thermoplasmatota archaeon]
MLRAGVLLLALGLALVALPAPAQAVVVCVDQELEWGCEDGGRRCLLTVDEVAAERIGVCVH